jgi:hypothetical protein
MINRVKDVYGSAFFESIFDKVSHFTVHFFRDFEPNFPSIKREYKRLTTQEALDYLNEELCL